MLLSNIAPRIDGYQQCDALAMFNCIFAPCDRHTTSVYNPMTIFCTMFTDATLKW